MKKKSRGEDKEAEETLSRAANATESNSLPLISFVVIKQRKKSEQSDGNFELSLDMKKDSSDILSMLQGDAKVTLAEIRDYFEETREEGLLIDEFIYIMLKKLDYNSEGEKNNLVSSLIDLFDQIDVNGDKHLEWKEFTGYIIEIGMISKESSDVNLIKKYKPSTKEDGDRHEAEVKKIYYFERPKQVVILEKDSPKLKCYNIRKQANKWKANEILMHTGVVMSAEYVTAWDVLATTTNNNLINFWRYQDGYVFRNRITTPEIQLCMAYNEKGSKLLYTGGCDSVIHAYDPNPESISREVMHSEVSNSLTGDDKKTGHTGKIMDLVMLPMHNGIISGGMDKLVCLWSLDKLELVRQLEGHQKGVYTVEWAEEASLIFSGGIEHGIYIWNPYVQKKTFVMKGHEHSITKLRYLPGKNALVSADVSGVVKVWDVRTYTTVQQFSTSMKEIESLEIIKEPHMMIVGGKHLGFYECEKMENVNLTDDESCISIIYNSVFFTFITTHPKSVKVWDAETGKLESVYRNLTSQDITSVVIDVRQRKLFVGDSKGRVFAVNVKNGALMKKFAKHANVASCLVYSGETVELVSCGWDGIVMVHDDSPSESQSDARSKFSLHMDQVNYITLDENAKLLASCADDGLILVYNMETYRQEATLKGHDVEVKVCMFLGNSLCLVSSDIDGNIFFWKLTPPPVKHKLIAKIVNSYVNKENVLDSSLVKAMGFDDDNNLLYTGDSRGVLKVWNCEGVINEVKGINSEQKQMEESKTFMTEERKKEGTELVIAGKEIKAHKDGISSICFIKSPHCIATCSYDCMAYVWTPELKKIGSLILAHDSEFKLKVPKDEWLRQQKEKTIEVLKDVQKLYNKPEKSKSESDKSEESEHDKEEESEKESKSSTMEASGDIDRLNTTELWFGSKDDKKEIYKPKAKPNLLRKLYHEKKDRIRRVQETSKKSVQAKYLFP